MINKHIVVFLSIYKQIDTFLHGKYKKINISALFPNKLYIFAN